MTILASLFMTGMRLALQLRSSLQV
jgi:hypothetical protein